MEYWTPSLAVDDEFEKLVQRVNPPRYPYRPLPPPHVISRNPLFSFSFLGEATDLLYYFYCFNGFVDVVALFLEIDFQGYS